MGQVPQVPGGLSKNIVSQVLGSEASKEMKRVAEINDSSRGSIAYNERGGM